MQKYAVAIALVAIIVIFLIFCYTPAEALIGEKLYKMAYGGLNLPIRNGSYLGSMATLNAIENASKTTDIRLD